MFKKLFNALTGDAENQENKQPQHQNPFAKNNNNQQEEEEEYNEVEFDEETLHGTHYSENEFDTEVQSRVQHELESRNETNCSDQDRQNYEFNIRRDVYKEWTGANTDQMLRWEMANSKKHTGFATSGFVNNDSEVANNPMLAPVHGITLRDYADMAMKSMQGVDEETINKAMGIDKTIFDEVSTIWVQRMVEDTSFTISVLYGQYFSEGIQNPKLLALASNVSEDGKANLEKLKTDRYFYEELAGARQAAYEYGIDGAQWILDNYGIGLGDFQGVAMQYMEAQNKDFNSENITHYLDYQQEKQKEYAAKFAAEQGGNVADDVEF